MTISQTANCVTTCIDASCCYASKTHEIRFRAARSLREIEGEIEESGPCPLRLPMHSSLVSIRVLNRIRSG